MNTETPFEKFLNQHDEEAWSATLATLLRSIHEVDRNAIQIWFAFYPLALFRALEQSDDRDKLAKKSPEQILRERAKVDSQGLLGFLKTVNKQFTVTHDENDEKAKYKLNDGQDLAWGAADDRARDWVAIDPRRMEGPIPVECRSASCGTCWVGVLGGADRLADVAAREGKKIKEFGYIDTAEPKPLIRLACQAQAQGAVSVVIPPWNGQFGKHLRALKEEAQAHMPASPEPGKDAIPEIIQ